MAQKGEEPPAKPRRRNSLRFGLGVKSLDAGEAAPPFALSMKVLPAANLNDAHRPNTTYVIRNGLLTMTSGDDYDAVIDASSGRLVQFTVYDAADEPSDKAAGKKASDDNAKKAETMICRISFEAGAFERRLKEVHEMARRYPDDYDARNPLTSFCGFIADEEPAWRLLLSQPGDEQAATELRTLRLLLNRHVMAGLEDLCYRILETSDGDFPLDGECSENAISFDNMEHGLVSVVHLAMFSCDFAFPRHSWPWTLAREASLTVLGKGQYTEGELQKLYASDSSGPLAFLTASTLLRFTSVDASRLYAARGLEKLRSTISARTTGSSWTTTRPRAGRSCGWQPTFAQCPTRKWSSWRSSTRSRIRSTFAQRCGRCGAIARNR